MRSSGAAFKLAFTVLAMTSGCVAATNEDGTTEDPAHLAQRVPIDWGDTPSTDAAADGGRSAPSDAAPSSSPPPAPEASVPPKPDAGRGTPPRTTPITPPPNPSGGPVTLRDPNGLYFANVVAGGTGCPAGSWSVQISSDGKAFTLVFSKYELPLNDRDSVDRKSLNCTINIAMNSPAGLSYAVTSLSYSGTAFLEPGVRASHTAYYSFTGQRIQSVDGSRQRRVKQDFIGPFDDTFVFEDNVTTTDLVFSECGRQRNLNVITTLQAVNTDPKRNGYIHIAAIDGRTTGAIILKITTRPCRL